MAIVSVVNMKKMTRSKTCIKKKLLQCVLLVILNRYAV